MRTILLKKLSIVLLFVALIFSCEDEKRIPPKGYIPNTSKATEQLEAQYFWTSQSKLSASYWKDANYVEVSLSDIETKHLYGDGYLNMTGTYNGTSSFNRGKNPEVKLKAGYDDEYLYILVEWKDTTADASYMTWKYFGPEDSRKEDSASGWTSQKNQDNVTLLFDKEDGSKDAWRWSLAYTAPFEMALNLNASTDGKLDEFSIPAVRNAVSEGSRVGPEYQWNGVRQEITRQDGSKNILDPAYYLLNDKKTKVSGNVESGMSIFNNKADCKFCHGPNGNGESEGSDGGYLASEFTNKYSNEGLVDFISSSGHEGSGAQYWGRIKTDSNNIADLIAFIRGIAGVPGYILTEPEEKDVTALSNISVGGIDKQNSEYRVLFRRKLMSSKSEDVSFSPDKTYTISIQFSDNDEINYVGASGIELVFKSNKL